MQYTELQWRDGQPYSGLFDDIYYAANDDESICGEKEFEHVFFRHNGLPERWNGKEDFVIAELGFGSGLNCLLTMREWLQHCDAKKSEQRLHYIAIEKYPLSPAAIAELISRYPELKIYCDELLGNYPPAIEAAHSRRLFGGRVVVHYRFMDAARALANERFKVDAWYLDGFSPAKNADMWSLDLFMKLARNSHIGTTCSTYTAAGFVRRNLQQAGFTVSKTAGYGKKRDMLVARFGQENNSALNYADRPWYAAPSTPEVSVKTATILGAGIAGLCVARALIRRGWCVDMIDRQGAIASETSANPVAITYPRLSVDNAIDTEFYIAAYCYNLYELNRLQQKHAQEFWSACGLRQSIDSGRIAAIIKKFDLNEEFVSISEALTAEAETALPVITDEQQIYAVYETAGVILPPVLADVLKLECGHRLRLIDAEVTAISKMEDGWQCYSADGLVTTNEILIIANGASVNESGMDLHFPIETVRGQLVTLKANAASEKIRQAVNSGCYITPAISGSHYLGASYSRQNKSLAISDTDNVELLESVNAVFPALFSRDDLGDAWAGFRAMSKDRVPLVGALPDKDYFQEEYADICHGRTQRSYRPAQYRDGLYLSAAHGSRGFTTSFISAEIIAALIAGEPLPVSKSVMDYISPSRFIVNDLKRR